MHFNYDTFKEKKGVIFLTAIAFVYCWFEAEGNGDFYIFTQAAGVLAKHENIYEHKFLEFYNYFYSVLFAILLKPFYYLPFFWVKFCWLFINLFLFFRLFVLLSKAEILNTLSVNQKNYFLLLVFIFSFRFLHENIHTSQITILILWCCVYGLYTIHHSKPITGSAILALGINIKLLPIVFLPYLLYRGQFKGFFLTLTFYLFSLAIPSLIIGHEYNVYLLKSWFALINPSNEIHVLDVSERSFHSLSTLLSTLLVKNVPDTYALNIPRNIADVSLPTLSLILNGVRLALIAFTLYFLKWPPFKAAVSQWKQLIEVSYLLLLIPLLFPHQQHYAFLFIVPAFTVSLFFVFSNYSRLTKFALYSFTFLLAIIYLASNLKLLLGEYNYYYEHFKLLSYAALLLVPALIRVSITENVKQK